MSGRLFGARSDAVQWRDEWLQETWITDPLLRPRRRMDKLTGLAGYESLGHWVLPADAGWRVALRGWFAERAQPVLAFRAVGKGQLILSTQPLGISRNLEDARWQLHSFLGVTNRLEQVAVVDRSAGLSAGGAEFLNFEQQPGTYYLGVEERYESQPQSRMLLRRSLRVADRPLEPDDTPALAKRVPPGVESAANLLPRDDRDWRRIQVDEPGVLQVQVGNVPDNLDPVLEIGRAAPPAAPLRVLYLEGNPANGIDESRYEGVAFTRIDAAAPGATNILARLDELQMLVIASLSDAAQFGLNRKAAHERIRAFAERGGKVLVCAPQGVSFAENSPAMGGVLEAWSSEWDGGGWRALNLTDGFAPPGQHGRGWCCGNGAKFPHALTWSFGGVARAIDRMVVHNNTNTQGARARSLELLAGADTNSLRRVGTFTAADTDERQEFSFPAVNCRVVRLLVNTNYGHAVETQMGEVQFFGPESIPGFLGIRNDGVASGGNLDTVHPLHWIVRGRAAGDVNGWPDYGRDGRWLDPEGAGFLDLFPEHGDPARRTATALRQTGGGWIAVDAQRLTSPANQAAAAWKWQNYLDVASGRIGEFDRTQDGADGGTETVVLPTRGGEDFLVGISDQVAKDNLGNQSPAPWVFSSLFRPAGLANEPNDTWESATPMVPGGTVRDNFFPENDHDWFRFPVEQSADVDVRLLDVPSSVDAGVDIYRYEAGIAPQRVLYLTCRTDTDLDRRDYGPLPLRFTRVDAGTPGEASAWDLLDSSTVAILEGLDDRHRFGMDLPETYRKIQRFVEQGGTFILLAPGAYSYSAIGRGGGAKLAGASESMNDSYWGPQNLVDGYWEEGNGRGGWSSREGSPFPHRVVFETAGPTPPTLDRLVVHNTAQRPERAVRELEIQFADRNEDGAFKSAGRFQCTNSTVRQEFSFPPAAPRFIKVLMLSNHGDKEETQCGEIEFFGPGGMEAPFGVPHFRGLESGSRIAATDPAHWIAARREQDGNEFWYARWNGHFTGWREQGFRMVFASGANTNDFAVTLARPAGKGWLVLDSQDLGNPENAQRNEWKLLNYFRMPSTRVGRYNQTTRDNAPGGAEIFRFPASPGPYYAHVTGLPAGAFSAQHYRLSLAAHPVERAFEPNDTAAQATPLQPGVVHRVTFFPERDADWFKVDLPAGAPLVFETLRIPARMSLRVLIYAGTNTQETVQTFGYRGPGVPVMGRFDPKAGGVHYLRLVDENGERQPCLEPLEFLVRYAGKAAPTPLRVLATAPPAESAGVSSNASFRVMLSAPLAADAVRAGALAAKGSLSGEVAGRVSGDPAAGTLVFTPEKPFRPGETATITLPAGLRDAAGNALPAAYSWPVVIRTDAARQTECVFRIELQPPSPLPPGSARVTISPSVPLRAPPEITAVTDAGRNLALSAPVKDAAGNWSCTMTVPAGLPRQSVLFACTALDQQGRRARKIAQGARCEVDGQPPPALEGVTARPGRNGKAVLSWPRPLGWTTSAATRCTGRRRRTRREASTLAGRLTGADVLTCEDPTPRDGVWHYRVALVDQAGNRGPLSAPAAVTTDRVPPKAAVAAVTARVVRKPGIELQWTAATGDAFAGYSLFRVREGEPAPTPATAVPWAEPAPDVLSPRSCRGRRPTGSTWPRTTPRGTSARSRRPRP
ncbi:MAG: Ig-like domain-containing protein [Kiritimatiellia bacterium]